jgi:ribonuclease HI
VFAEISIDTDREEASERAAALLDTPDTVVYSDSSATGGQTGAAAVMLDQNQKITQFRQTSVGPTTNWTIHAAELIGIHQAIEMITDQVCGGRVVGHPQGHTLTILSDSRSALQAIAMPSNKPGQHIVHTILGAAKSLTAHNVRLRLQWVPGHSDNQETMRRTGWLKRRSAQTSPTSFAIWPRDRRNLMRTKLAQSGRMQEGWASAEN